jgi:hypothetical protein
MTDDRSWDWLGWLLLAIAAVYFGAHALLTI